MASTAGASTAGASTAGAGASVAGAAKIFRYKLTDAIMASITQFAKIHQLDDRHDYKEAWGLWLLENRDYVDREVSRLQQLGYKGDVEDKMFKAGRYYFREKTSVIVLEKKEEKPKTRGYIVMAPEIIKAMDQHLCSIMKNKDFKPAVGYNQFCDKEVDLLKVEVRRLLDEYKDSIDSSALAVKFKKTYKNRYFILSKE